MNTPNKGRDGPWRLRGGLRGEGEVSGGARREDEEARRVEAGKGKERGWIRESGPQEELTGVCKGRRREAKAALP